MALPDAVSREPIHTRNISMNVYSRQDGKYDVDAHLVDTKPFAFPRLGAAQPVPAGHALHDLWVRLTVDSGYIVCEVSAWSRATPYALCKEAERTLAVLVGERIASGWSANVKARLRGQAGCTHLTEMLIPMATAALQAIRGVRRRGQTRFDPEDMDVKLNSCYAYADHRNIVKVYWPRHYRRGDKD